MVSKKVIVTLCVILFAVGCATTRLPTMKLPGQSGASAVLQRDVLQMPMFWPDSICKQVKVVNTEIVDYPKNPGKDPWTEKWTVDRCGEMVYYEVVFTPTPEIGGTDFRVSIWK